MENLTFIGFFQKMDAARRNIALPLVLIQFIWVFSQAFAGHCHHPWGSDHQDVVDHHYNHSHHQATQCQGSDHAHISHGDHYDGDFWDYLSCIFSVEHCHDCAYQAIAPERTTEIVKVVDELMELPDRESMIRLDLVAFKSEGLWYPEVSFLKHRILRSIYFRGPPSMDLQG